MNSDVGQLRSELEGKFQPPIDVLLDPSLLVASRPLEKLSDSAIFESQTQATLGGIPTEPRLGDVYVPSAFRALIASEGQPGVQKTKAWEFYRGKADTAFLENVVSVLDQNEVDEYTGESDDFDYSWTNVFEDPSEQEQVVQIIEEEASFLRTGGLVLSRTSVYLEALRDSSVPIVDVGSAELAPELQETLTNVGYQDPAPTCAFGISSAGSAVDALVDDVLSTNSDLLVYRIGG